MKTKQLFVLGLASLLITSCTGVSIIETTTSPIESDETTSETISNDHTNSSSTGTGDTSTSNPAPTISNGDKIDEYYNDILINENNLTDGVEGTLRSTITSIITPKAYFTYSGSTAGKLGYELCDIDEDPKNPDNMYLFYSRDSIKKEKSKNWNREHCWPQSLSGGLYGTSIAGADALHIRPTAISTNGDRGSKLNGSLNKQGTEVRNNKQYNTNSLADWMSIEKNIFEPLDEVKGDCARIIFYLYTCYYNSKKLVITNVATSISLLLDWNRMDPPDDIELLRNDRVFASKQKNRNPFVDHPEWVDRIFG